MQKSRNMNELCYPCSCCHPISPHYAPETERAKKHMPAMLSPRLKSQLGIKVFHAGYGHVVWEMYTKLLCAFSISDRCIPPRS